MAGSEHDQSGEHRIEIRRFYDAIGPDGIGSISIPVFSDEALLDYASTQAALKATNSDYIQASVLVDVHMRLTDEFGDFSADLVGRVSRGPKVFLDAQRIWTNPNSDLNAAIQEQNTDSGLLRSALTSGGMVVQGRSGKPYPVMGNERARFISFTPSGIAGFTNGPNVSGGLQRPMR